MESRQQRKNVHILGIKKGNRTQKRCTAIGKENKASVCVCVFLCVTAV